MRSGSPGRFAFEGHVKRRWSDRSAEAQAYRHLYKTTEWKSLRAWRLRTEPLCRSCKEQGRITPATVCDHIKPHRGDTRLFFDPSNTQSLCDQEPYRCHSSGKQKQETRGYVVGVDAFGRPLDPDHPWNR